MLNLVGSGLRYNGQCRQVKKNNDMTHRLELWAKVLENISELVSAGVLSQSTYEHYYKLYKNEQND